MSRDESAPDTGSWSSGYDVALTQRRSPVRIRPSPFDKRGSTDSVKIALHPPLDVGCTASPPGGYQQHLTRDRLVRGEDSAAGESRDSTALGDDLRFRRRLSGDLPCAVGSEEGYQRSRRKTWQEWRHKRLKSDQQFRDCHSWRWGRQTEQGLPSEDRSGAVEEAVRVVGCGSAVIQTTERTRRRTSCAQAYRNRSSEDR